MFSRYFVTGASGFLGSQVVRALLDAGARVSALVFPGDRLAKEIPKETKGYYGDICDKEAVRSWLSQANGDSCVIHCAGIVSVSSAPGEILRRVNVGGTENILAAARQAGVKKLVYVSSVHAMADKPHGETIAETQEFSPSLVEGAYAKTKAEATASVLSATDIDASVVMPSGIIGPKDRSHGSITTMISSYFAGKMPMGVRGGYDFVDVRDVAHGIVSSSEKGKRGECYILSGAYASIKQILSILADIGNGKKINTYIPLSFAKLVAPIAELWGTLRKKAPFFTPYSIRVLGTNSAFTHEKATREFGYSPRPLAETLADTVKWLSGERII